MDKNVESVDLVQSDTNGHNRLRSEGVVFRVPHIDTGWLSSILLFFKTRQSMWSERTAFVT